MRIEPLFDRVLVLPIPEGSVSKGGLLIPAIAERSKIFQYGDVVAVGPGRYAVDGRLVPCAVKVGQVVAYPRKAGTLIPVTNDEGDEIPHVLMREPDILGIVHDLPRQTSITGIDGKLLSMVPTSKGLPDAVYQNREELEVAERAGFVEPGEFPPDEFEPGDGPVELGTR